MNMNGTTIHCLKCDDYITGDKKGNLISCSCGACSIDETPDYIRILGDFNDIEVKNENGEWTKLNTSSSKPKRIDKTNYYLNIAESASLRSTCLKRRYGAIIVKNDEIISTGYNGAPRGLSSCIDTGECLRENSDRGTDYSNCVSCHAEMNTIISASRQEMLNSDLYLVGVDTNTLDYIKDPSPCSICKRLIINAGINKIFVRTSTTEYKVFYSNQWEEKDITGGY